MRNSLPHWALVLALTLAALPRAGSAGVRQVSLTPQFDTHKHYQSKSAVKLRFLLQDKGTGAPVAKKDVRFFLRHAGPKETPVELPVRAVKAGVFEVPFAPERPGQYALFAAVSGTQVGAVAPVRLGVIGLVDGLIPVPESKDAEFTQQANLAGRRSTR